MCDLTAELDRGRILEAQQRGRLATLRLYLGLSGPGWLQSAITLGGGSLAGSLYLGIVGGYDLLWVQPLMMALGIVMLMAIAQVTLISGQRPMQALSQHVSPVLAWTWIIATIMANLIWAMPQFSLGIAALRQNLGAWQGAEGPYIAGAVLLGASLLVVWLNARGGLAFRVFDVLLKLMVAAIVGCFFIVVGALSASADGLPWARIFEGFIPNPSMLTEPTPALGDLIRASSAPAYWESVVVAAQRDRLVAAAATAVGINMTFLLPYSMLARGWDRAHVGLAKFDLAIGLFIPYVLATSCVMIVAATQFHAVPVDNLEGARLGDPAAAASVDRQVLAEYEAILTRMKVETASSKVMVEADRVIAATLIQRDAFALANSLEGTIGKGPAQRVFGIGVVGMAVSSIVILMLINGLALCEASGCRAKGSVYWAGCVAPGVFGLLGALFLWTGKARFYLAVPTSRVGMVLLPIAFVGFFLLMNRHGRGRDPIVRGRSRFLWNVAMLLACAVSFAGAVFAIAYDQTLVPGTAIRVRNVVIVGASVIGIVILAQVIRKQWFAGPSDDPAA